jgi:DNA replication initiation complex subunit (GINS family)
MEELNYEIIRRIQTKEKGPSLAELPPNFYELVPSLVAKYKNEQNFREYENVLKILRYIYSRRQEKIVTAAMNVLRGIEAPAGMVEKEQQLYERMLGMLKSDEEHFKNLISAGDVMPRAEEQTAVQAAVPTIAAEVETLKVEQRLFVLKDVDEFVGLDGKAYGPFKNGDVVDIPHEEADMLVKMKAAEWKERK